MGLATAPERPVATVGEINLFSVSLAGALDKGGTGELATGTPTVAEVTSSDLTITNVVVSTAELIINDITVAIGKAVQFLVVGHLEANSPYTLKIIFTTDSTPAQTKIRYVEFPVEA